MPEIGVVSFSRGEREVPTRSALRRHHADTRRHFAPLAGRLHHPLRQGWDLPHQTYVVHFPDDGLFKVGVGRTGGSRLAELARSGEMVLVDVLEVTDYAAATVLEQDVLDLVDQWWMLGDPGRYPGGYTEMWSDAGPTADLRSVVNPTWLT